MADPAVQTQVDTEAAKAARELEEVVRQLEVAAREWGVRPDHLEGRFVSALLGTLTWLGRLMQATTADQKASAQEARVASATELEKLRVANEAANKVIGKASVALASTEVQHERVIGRFVETVAPQLVKAIGEAVVIRERSHNQRVQWGRAAGVAGLGLALVVGGHVWGNQHATDVAAGAIALERIRQCQAAPVLDARTKEAFCPMKALIAPS